MRIHAMNCRKVLLAAAFMPMLCLGTVPPPFAYESSLLDRIGSATTAMHSRRVALEFLERVAEGKLPDIDSKLAAQVGLKEDELQKLLAANLRHPTVRVHTLFVLGRTGLQEAVDFLSNLREENLGVGTSHRVWPAVQIALQQARLALILDPQQKIEFLEGILSELYRGPASGEVVSWAEDELCNQGSLISLPNIRASILRHQSIHAEGEIRFCEARLRVLSRGPDRLASLGYVLNVGNSEDARVTRWAIDELASMHSSKADEMLDRYATEIERLPAGSLERQRQSEFRQTILTLRIERKR
jgi:hypothetical protein